MGKPDRAPLSEYAKKTFPTPRKMDKGVLWGGCICAVLSAPLLFLNADGVVSFVVFNAVALLVGYLISRKVYSDTKNRLELCLDWNDLDLALSTALRREIGDLVANYSQLQDAASPGISVYRAWRVGEVTRHFDQQMQATIDGWLEHRLGVEGYLLGTQIGRVGLGVGQVGIGGTSDVHLNLLAVTRADLISNAFLAVLEQDRPNGVVDTIRVVVPPDPEVRAYVQAVIRALGQKITTGSHCGMTFMACDVAIKTAATTDASYVSDRLSALLRMPADKRSTVDVIGAQVSSHTLIGCAIQFSGDERWHPLFPTGLLQQLSVIVGRTVASATPPP